MTDMQNRIAEMAARAKAAADAAQELERNEQASEARKEAERDAARKEFQNRFLMVFGKACEDLKDAFSSSGLKTDIRLEPTPGSAYLYIALSAISDDARRYHLRLLDTNVLVYRMIGVNRGAPILNKPIMNVDEPVLTAMLLGIIDELIEQKR